MSKNFIRRKENFTCEQCDWTVVGNGFTNHCPKCLFSKHVDESPGDRLNDCRGLMAPIGLDRRQGEERIVHRCIICGMVKPNVVASDDDLAVLTQVLLQSSSYQTKQNKKHD